ncbi:MAG TPA: hypothetical protein VLE48_05025 [Terriglobales bacterium]|nr:hypothetical protein [Terriglobales bacterium]
MSLPRTQLLLLALLISAHGQGTPKAAPGPDALCTYFEAVLREAPAKFAALRGKPIEGFTPMWEGKLKAPGATGCEASEQGYFCSLGFRPDQAKGKREFAALGKRARACFPGWTAEDSRDESAWRFVLARDHTRVSVDYSGLVPSGDEEDEQPELTLSVYIAGK